MINELDSKEIWKNFNSLNINSHSRHFIATGGKRAEKSHSQCTDDLRLLIDILTGICGLHAYPVRYPLDFIKMMRKPECKALEKNEKDLF